MSEERFATAAQLPDRIHRLHELALDLWWSWDSRAREAFRRLDYPLWRASAHNPVRMLQMITAERLAAVAGEVRAVGGPHHAVPHPIGAGLELDRDERLGAPGPVDARAAPQHVVDHRLECQRLAVGGNAGVERDVGAAQGHAGPCSLRLNASSLKRDHRERAYEKRGARSDDNCPSTFRLRLLNNDGCRCWSCGDGTRTRRKRIEREGEIARGLKTLLGFLFEAMAHDAIESGR